MDDKVETHASRNETPDNKSSGTNEVSPLKVFLCHSSTDKSAVRTLYNRLKSDGFSPWLDEENLIGGQDWEVEIEKAVRTSDVVLVCLSHKSSSKVGFVHREIKYALDVADEQPEGMAFIIPLKVEECEVPARLAKWHWINYFEENGNERLVRALQARAKDGARAAHRVTLQANFATPADSSVGLVENRPPTSLRVDHSPRTAQQEPPPPGKRRDKAAVLAFAGCFLVTLLVFGLAFRQLSPFQLTVFRILLSGFAAGVAVFLPGLFQTEIKSFLRAGAGLAVFAIAFSVNPAKLIKPHLPAVYRGPGGVWEMTADGWVEHSTSHPGTPFMFEELEHDAQYLYLVDRSRLRKNDPDNPILVRLPIKGGTAQWSWSNPLAWNDLTVVTPGNH